MLEIKNKAGLYLELLSDTQVEIERNFWLLGSNDTLPGSYSFPFKFPLTPNNCAFVGHKNRIEASVFVGIDIEMAVNGLPFGVGQLSFKINDEVADGFLKLESSNVAFLLKSKHLHDVFEYDITTLGTASTQAVLDAELLKTTNPATNPYPFCFFPVYAPKFTNETFEDVNFHYRPFINAGVWENNAWRFSHDLKVSSATIDYGYGFPLVPFFRFTYIIEKVCAFLGYAAKGSWLSDPEVKALVMFNTVALAVKNSLPVSVQTKYHVWNMTMKDLMLYLRDEMAVSVQFVDAEKAIYFDYFTTISADLSATDLSENVIKGYRTEPINGTGYSVSFAANDDQTYNNYQIGQGEKEITLGAKTLKMVHDTKMYGKSEFDWYLPSTEQSGLSLSYLYFNMGLSVKDFPIKNEPILLSFRGMQPSRNGKSYPLGTSFGRNALQATVGRMALQPTEINSLFHSQIKPFLEFKDATKRITFQLLLSLAKASSLKMSQKIVIGNSEITPMAYLVEQITYQFPDQHGYLIAQMQAWPLLPPVNQQPLPKMIWVELITEELVFLVDIGWFPDPNNIGVITTNAGVKSLQIKFRFWLDQAKTQPAYTSQTVYFRYIERKHYFDSSGTEIDDSRIINQNAKANDQHEIVGQYSWNIFETDVAANQITTDKDYLGIRLSLQIEPCGGYYIL